MMTLYLVTQYRAVCRNFAKGGKTLGYLKKRGVGGAASGGGLEDNVKKLAW